MSRSSKHAPSSASTPVGSALRNRPPQNYRTKPVSSRNPKKTRLIPSFRGEPIPAPATLRRDPSQLRHRGRNSSALVPVRRRPSGAIPDKTPTEAIFEPQLKENKHIPSFRDEPIPAPATLRRDPSQLRHRVWNSSALDPVRRRPSRAVRQRITERSHFRPRTRRKHASYPLFEANPFPPRQRSAALPRNCGTAAGIPRHLSLFGTSPSGTARRKITERSHFRPRTRRKHASYPLFEANQFPPRQRSAALPRNCGTAAGIPRHLSLSGAVPLEPSATKHQPKPFSNHNPKKTSTYPLFEANPFPPRQRSAALPRNCGTAAGNSSALVPVRHQPLRNRPPQNYRTKPFSTPNPKKTRLIPSFRGEPIPAPATLRRAPSQLRHRGRNSSALVPVRHQPLWSRPPKNYRTKPFSTPNPKKTRLIPSFRGEPIPAPATLRRAPSQLRHRGRNSSALVPVRRRPSGAIRDKTPTEAIFKPQPKENKHIPSMRDEPIKPRAGCAT
jgi:hypothetical protein